MLEFDFTGDLFRWKGDSAWYFIALPEDMSRDIDRFCSGMKGGWGSLKVSATIGVTTFQTSIFPSKERHTYILPVKAAVRKAEQIDDGSTVEVTLSI